MKRKKSNNSISLRVVYVIVIVYYSIFTLTTKMIFAMFLIFFFVKVTNDFENSNRFNCFEEKLRMFLNNNCEFTFIIFIKPIKLRIINCYYNFNNFLWNL